MIVVGDAGNEKGGLACSRSYLIGIVSSEAICLGSMYVVCVNTTLFLSIIVMFFPSKMSDVCDVLLLRRSDKAGKMLAEEVLLKGLQGHRSTYYFTRSGKFRFCCSPKFLFRCSWFSQAGDSRRFLIRSKSNFQMPSDFG